MDQFYSDNAEASRSKLWGRPFVPERLRVQRRSNAVISRVGDDPIDLRVGCGRRNISPHNIVYPSGRFHYIDFLFASEFIYCLINVDQPTGKKWKLGPVKVSAVGAYLNRLSSVNGELLEEGCTFFNMDQKTLDRWLAKQRDLVHPATLVHKINLIRRIWHYRSFYTKDVPDFAPWDQITSTKLARYKLARENKTPRIPPDIHGVALRWSLFIIDEVGPCLLDFRKQVVRPPESHVRLPARVADARVQRFLEAVAEGTDTIPVNAAGEVIWGRLSAMVGVSTAVLKYRRNELSATIDKFGSTETGSNVDWPCIPGTGVPWADNMSGRASFLQFNLVIAACYYIIGLFSGMRDSEATALNQGCLRVQVDEEGKPYRYFLDGVIHKGRSAPEGEAHAWVVNQPVAKAVIIAQTVQDHLKAVRKHEVRSELTNSLFLATHIFEQGFGGFNEKSANHLMNTLFSHCDKLARNALEKAGSEGERQAAESLIFPLHRGEKWKFSNRQLRRTLAWFIARKPHGIVAGALQYGHVGSLAFEGYAGDSTSGFRQEIEEERELGRLEDIVALYENYRDGGSLGGPYAKRLGEEFDSIIAEQGDLPGTVVDDVRRTRAFFDQLGS